MFQWLTAERFRCRRRRNGIAGTVCFNSHPSTSPFPCSKVERRTLRESEEKRAERPTPRQTFIPLPLAPFAFEPVAPQSSVCSRDRHNADTKTLSSLQSTAQRASTEQTESRGSCSPNPGPSSPRGTPTFAPNRAPSMPFPWWRCDGGRIAKSQGTRLARKLGQRGSGGAREGRTDEVEKDHADESFVGFEIARGVGSLVHCVRRDKSARASSDWKAERANRSNR